MATYLLDTNILLRLSDPSAAGHGQASRAIIRLRQENHTLFFTAQNIIEFFAADA